MGKESFRWLVGNGNTIMFWEDIWCGERPLIVEFPRLFHLVNNKKGLVKDFLNSNGFNKVNWVDFFIRPLLDRELNMLNRLKEVVSSKVLLPEEEDRLIWIHDNNGVFSLKVPPRARSFLWIISIDRLPTKEFLIKRGVQIY
ncbi:hypothetical protein Goshw_030035 [Gossypium schwendimanii]|uniref:Reverse transcriptase zinc-binding domain-containing protein n=1 Tax=Gossypium schwendimanii TaxID=34291 RepID=A0A7J9L6U5_GOSSC|nr:hypothetical protein [Gossypium schwendimanii]